MSTRTHLSQFRDIAIFLDCNLDNLLKQKGHDYANYSESKRLCLLLSEVSELVDAIKKDKGADEEAYELADIVIRAFNYRLVFIKSNSVCLTLDRFEKYMISPIKELYAGRLILQTLQESTSVCDYDNIKDKYHLCESLHKKCIKIQDICLNSDNAPEVSDFRARDIYNVEILSAIYSVAKLCMIYYEEHLSSKINEQHLLARDDRFGRDLFWYVEDKMRKNWSRPYKYGLSENADCDN
ncbi:MAG: hypothetical protein RR420_01065 [Anaerovoracaceae bacterium]